jgi:glycosyltransferase involved in cell wall biosynthesis
MGEPIRPKRRAAGVSASGVSVVIPVHNRADLVSRAIRSVLDQTRPPEEVIVVDDGSTDATPEILATFGSDIRVLRHDRPRERGAARNAGARSARGEMLAFLDSDDEWKPDKLARQLRAQVPVSVTGIENVDTAGSTVRPDYAPPATAWDQLLRHNRYHGAPSSLLIDSDLFHGIGGFPEERAVQGSEDWLLLVKLRASGSPIMVLPVPLVRYRVHEANSTNDPAFVARSMWSAVTWLERHEILDGKDVRIARAHKAGFIGRRYANAGKWRQAAVWSWKAVRWGSAPDCVLAVAMIAASGARGALRRRGI